MGKKIKNPIEVKAVVNILTYNPIIFEVVDVSVHYGLDCEHGDLGRKGLPLEQNTEIVNSMRDCVEEAIVQIEEHEEITEQEGE